MMEQIRNATKTWLAGVVVGLLVISFAMWGVQDIFTTNLNDPVAVVGDQEIDVSTFAQEYNQTYRQTRAQFGGNLTQAEALAMDLHRNALDNIVRRTVVNQLTEQLGLRASNETLQRQIVSNPAFAGPTGQFEQRTYYEQLASAGYTPQSFENAMRQDLRRSQLLGTIVSGLYVPRELAIAHFEYGFEAREVEYFLLPPASAGEISDPGDETLQIYFDQNPSAYRAPEYRGLTMLRLSVADLAADTEIPEDDILTIYEIRRSSYEVPERRRIEQLTFPTEEAAQAAQYMLEQGVEFENVGGAYVDLGTVAQDEGLDEVVMEAAFALREPGVTGIVEGSLSTSIVKVSAIIPGETVELEDVHDQIRTELATQIAGEEIFAISENVQDMLAGGEDITIIADQMNLDIVTADAIDQFGRSSDGTDHPAFTGTPGLLQAAFDLTEGEDSGFRDTPEGDFYVVRVDHITPARTKDFAEVRGEVLDDWREGQVADTLNALATDAAARVNGGEDFAAVAQSLGREVRSTPRSIRRSGTTEVFSGSLLNTLFTNAAGTAASGPVQLGASYVVARVTNVIPADVEAAGEQLSTLRTALEDRIASELINQFVDDAENSMNIRINEQVLTQAVSQIN